MVVIEFLSSLWSNIVDYIKSTDTQTLIEIIGLIIVLLQIIVSAFKKFFAVPETEKKQEKVEILQSDKDAIKKFYLNNTMISGIICKVPKYIMGFNAEERRAGKKIAKKALEYEILQNPDKNPYIVAGDMYSKNIDQYLSIDFRDYKLASHWYSQARMTSPDEARNRLRNLTYKRGTIRAKKKVSKFLGALLIVIFGVLIYLFRLCPDFMSGLWPFSGPLAGTSVMLQHIVLSLAACLIIGIIAFISNRLNHVQGIPLLMLFQIIAILVCNKLNFSWELCMQQWTTFACSITVAYCYNALLLELNGCLSFANSFKLIQKNNFSQFERAKDTVWGLIISSISSLLTTGLGVLVLWLPTGWALTLYTLYYILKIIYYFIVFSKAEPHETDMLSTIMEAISSDDSDEQLAITDGSSEACALEEAVEVENND